MSSLIFLFSGKFWFHKDRHTVTHETIIYDHGKIIIKKKYGKTKTKKSCVLATYQEKPRDSRRIYKCCGLKHRESVCTPFGPTSKFSTLDRIYLRLVNRFNTDRVSFIKKENKQG